MTESQLTATVIQIPIGELISLLTAINHRDFTQFEQLERNFATDYGMEIWEEYFNFRLLPALDRTSNHWLFEQKLKGTE